MNTCAVIFIGMLPLDILKHIESFNLKYDPQKHTWNYLSSTFNIKGIEYLLKHNIGSCSQQDVIVSMKHNDIAFLEFMMDCYNKIVPISILDSIYIDEGCKYGNIKIIEYLLNKGYRYTHVAMDNACKNGHFELAIYLHKRGINGSIDAMDAAASNGYSDLLYLLHALGYQCTSYALDMAAKNGFIKSVKALLQLNKNCTSNAIDRAAKNGYFEIVRLLIQHNKSCTFYSIYFTLQNHHHNITQYICESVNTKYILNRTNPLQFNICNICVSDFVDDTNEYLLKIYFPKCVALKCIHPPIIRGMWKLNF